MGTLRRRFWGASEKPPVVRYSKMKCVAALTAAGLWPQVKAWIEEQGLYDLYVSAQDFAEDNAYFQQGIAVLRDKFGWEPEIIDMILSDCIMEE